MKKRNLILSVLLVLSAVVLTSCGGSGNNAAKEDDENILKVGMEANYAPFNWSQSSDSNGAVEIEGSKEFAAGYDVTIAKKVAESLGKKLVVVKTEWDGLIPALTSGKIDLIMAGMSPTKERAESIDFSSDYYSSDLVIMTLDSSEYSGSTKLSDFDGAKITAQLNTFHYTVIDQIPGVVKEPAMDNFSAMRVALESGVIDGYITERPEAESAIKVLDTFKLIELEDGFETSREDTAIAVGIKKGSDLTDKINKVLENISEEDRTNIMEEAKENQPSNN